jgi:pimeloyl-ACP methyl ester carboxylesterase
LLKNHDRQEDFDEPAGNVFRAAIWGSEDTWVSVENIDYLRSRYPELKVFIVENAYHCPMETHYAEFNHNLEQLLQ